MPLPPIPEKYMLGETLKLYESSQIEFKENTISFDKLKRTVCAFLNTIGGYIFVGVDDWCKVVGVPQKTADLFVLLVDQIIREKLIVREGDSQLTLDELSCHIVDLSGGEDKTILIVRCMPADLEKKYMWPTGERYYRLNASNYCRRDEATELIRLKEQVAELKLDRGRINSQLDTVMSALKKSLIAQERLRQQLDAREEEGQEPCSLATTLLKVVKLLVG
jgi:predicted HTH transcriptional regulator